MTRSLPLILGVFGVLFFTGCPEPEGQGPITVDPPRLEREREERLDRTDRDEGLGGTSSADLATRQRGLGVMLAEQRDVLRRLSRDASFSRVSTGMAERLRTALAECESDLDGIERNITLLGREDALPLEEIRSQQDDIKARLRRVAARLARMESALRDN